MDEWRRRYRCKQAVEVGYRRQHEERVCPFSKAEDVKRWIDLMLIESAEYDCVPTITGDEGDVIAQWNYSIPYTEQVIQEAKDWLEANPEAEDKLIRWRKNIPFQLNLDNDTETW